jgi:hypothetical protein
MPSIVSLNEYMFYWMVGLGFLGFILIAGVINYFKK